MNRLFLSSLVNKEGGRDVPSGPLRLSFIIQNRGASHTYVGVKAAVARASQPISASVVIWVIGGGVSGVVRHIRSID